MLSDLNFFFFSFTAQKDLFKLSLNLWCTNLQPFIHVINFYVQGNSHAEVWKNVSVMSSVMETDTTGSSSLQMQEEEDKFPQCCR